MSDERKRITVMREASAVIEEKRSEFIGTVCPVSDEDEARAFIERIKKEHYDARHNVFAYVLDGGNITRFTDDGEPKGSAGIPVLNVLKMSGVDGVCAVVTRYFGGILLGTGGLARAYSAAAKAALDAAGISTLEMFDVCEIRCSYSDYQKIVSKLQTVPATEEGSSFGEDVALRAVCKSSDSAALFALVTELTGGTSRGVVLYSEERAAN